MNLIRTRTIGEIAAENPCTIRAFEKFGIDYCCGGKRTLEDACSRVGVQLEDVESYLRRIERFQGNEKTLNLNNAKLTDLVRHIVEKHHVFTKNEIQRLDNLITKVCKSHCANHPELLRLNILFQKLCEDLIPHLMKEEQILFPYIEKLVEASEKKSSFQEPSFVTVVNPLQVMSMEHDKAGDTLSLMRRVTNNYALPDDACNSYRALYYGLEEFERDMHQHIHTENNILFPRAIELEKKIRKVFFSNCNSN